MKILIALLLVLILIELGRSAAPQSSVLVDANPAQDLDLKDLSNG